MSHSTRPHSHSDILFLTENQKKSERLQNIFPEATILSTQGIPFTVEMDIHPTQINYEVVPLHQKRDLIENLLSEAKDARLTILAFDQTPKGEAIAKGFEDSLKGTPTVRFPLNNLGREHCLKRLEDLERLQPQQYPRADIHRAQAYWTKVIMDLTWSKEVSSWTSGLEEILREVFPEELTSRSTSLSRIQCALLHTLHLHEHRRKTYRSIPYYEVHCQVVGPHCKAPIELPLTVPSLAQFDPESTPQAFRTWQEKLIQSQQDVQDGVAAPQAPVGNPWRFNSPDEAENYKHHLLKYPLIPLEKLERTTKNKEILPPHTLSSLFATTKSRGVSTYQEVYNTLEHLFLLGYITAPKTNQPNISQEAFSQLTVTAKRFKRKPGKTRRVFPNPKTGESYSNLLKEEGIRPTNWDVLPATAEKRLKDIFYSGKHELAAYFYKEIYLRAAASQLNPEEEVHLRATFVGPLPLSLAELDNTQTVRRESPTHAHMSVVLSTSMTLSQSNPLSIFLESSRPQDTFQVIGVKVLKKEPKKKDPLTAENLFHLLQEEGIGTVDTFNNTLEKLEKAGYIKLNDDQVFLTKKGDYMIRILNENLGQFIHTSYHRSMETHLHHIDEGNLNARDFLNLWWKTLQVVARTLPPTTESLLEGSEENLKKISKKDRAAEPYQKEELRVLESQIA